MSKLFIRLVSELKSLGCKIIYADYYRVIIATTRYVRYLFNLLLLYII